MSVFTSELVFSEDGVNVNLVCKFTYKAVYLILDQKASMQNLVCIVHATRKKGFEKENISSSYQFSVGDR